MFASARKAVRVIFDPTFRGVVLKSLLLTLVLFAALFFGAQYGLAHLPQFHWQWLNVAVDWLGSLLVVVGLFFLGAPVAALFASLFLDEIGETTLAMQVKLLRVLQERCIRPVGGGQESPVDVRVIAATNRNLLQQVQEGRFREDLYYRLSVIPVEVPPLRDRGDDVILLANHFLKKYAVQMGKPVVRLSSESLKTMKGYDWPGNVRVLENTIERAVAMFNPAMFNPAMPNPATPNPATPNGNDEELRVELPHNGNGGMPAAAALAGAPGVVLPADGIDLERYVADIEKSLLQSALRRSSGTQTRAAELLKLSYRSFRHMMKKYDLS